MATVGSDVHADGQSSASARLFFKLVLIGISSKKTLRIAAGAGSRVSQGQLLVSLHSRLDGFGDAVVPTLDSTRT